MPNRLALAADVDAVTELQLRRWARENYVSRDARDPAWHPLVLEEMGRKESEVPDARTIARRHAVVPLMPEQRLARQSAIAEQPRSTFETIPHYA